MPRVQITLADGSNKILDFENNYTESDIDDAVSYYNSQLPKQQPTQKVEQPTPQPEQPQAENKPLAPMEHPEETPTVNTDGNYSFNLGVEENVYNPIHDKSKWHDNLRQAGRNTARFLLPKGLENKYIGSKEDEEFLNKYNNSNVPTWEQINNDYKAGRINKNQMIKFGNLRKKLDDLTADAQYRNYRNKEYGKEGLLLAASAPGSYGLAGGGAVGAAGGAAVGGALYGLGNSIIDEDLNPLVEVPKDAALWGGGALLLGQGGKYLGKTKAGQYVMQKGGELLNKGMQKVAENPTGQKILNELTKERTLRPSANKVQPDYTQQLDEIRDIRRTNKAVEDAEKYNLAKFGTTKNNYFGGDYVPEVNYSGGNIKTSKLPQSMKQAGTLPQELENIKPEYEVLHNADTIKQATAEIENNPSGVLGELQAKASGKDELSALDFEKARQTLSKLYQEGRIDEALVLSDMISKKASQAGQSVQALSLWSRTTPEGAIRQAQKIIADYNKTAKKKLELTEEQAKKIMDLATKAQATELGTRENEIATQLLMKELKGLIPATAGSKLRTWQNISLLLNPVTFERNIGGNALFGGLENTATKTLAAGIDKAVSKFTGKRTRVLPQLKQYAQGLKQGFKEGVEDVGLGINTRDKLGTRFNLNDRTSFDDIPVLNQLEKALNYSLQVPDRMFYQAAYNESIANQLAATGLKEATPEMIQNATNEALEAVFQNNSKLGNAILKARQSGNELLNINGFGIGDAFIPYAQTPANIAVQGWNYSPLGFINTVKSGLAGNQRQATLDAARATIGTGLGALGLAGAKKGIINPALEDKKERENYKALGIRPSTVNIGDYNVSFNQLQPIAQPIMAGAVLGDAQQGDYMGAIDKGLGSLTDLGMLQSLTQFMSDYNQYGPGTATSNMVGSVPSRFVPTALRQLTDLTDNTQRDTYDKNPFKYGYNQVLAKIPGANKTLPVRYDVTGQPLPKRQTEGAARVADILFNPVIVNKRKSDTTTEKLIDLYNTTGDKSVLFPVADKNIQFKDLQGNQVKRPLNTTEKEEYQQQLGTLNKQLLDNIVNTSFYDNLDDEDKINLITATQRYAKSYVDENLWGKPNAQKRALVRKLLKTPKDKIINDIMKIYKNDVLPAKTKQIYDTNFR